MKALINLDENFKKDKICELAKIEAFREILFLVASGVCVFCAFIENGATKARYFDIVQSLEWILPRFPPVAKALTYVSFEKVQTKTVFWETQFETAFHEWVHNFRV